MVDLQEIVRQRVLGLFERRAILDPETVANMRQWAHGGFSLDATIRVEAWESGGRGSDPPIAEAVAHIWSDRPD